MLGHRDVASNDALDVDPFAESGHGRGAAALVRSNQQFEAHHQVASGPLGSDIPCGFLSANFVEQPNYSILDARTSRLGVCRHPTGAAADESVDEHAGRTTAPRFGGCPRRYSTTALDTSRPREIRASRTSQLSDNHPGGGPLPSTLGNIRPSCLIAKRKPCSASGSFTPGSANIKRIDIRPKPSV